MQNMSMNKDFWKLASDEVSNLKIEKPVVIENLTQMRQKGSIEEVFARSNKVLASIMPTGENTIKAVTKQNIPDSVKLLDRYAQKLGFLPMGEIYEGSGSKYIGRIEERTEKGEVYYKEFPELGEEFIDSPDIMQNLTFRANRAISKWNEFVSAESELGVFLKEIENPESRKAMIFKFAKTSSAGTDKLRMLSSLYYNYIDEKASNKNILRLEPNERLQLITILKEKSIQKEGNKKTGLETKYDQIEKFLSKNTSEAANFIRNYHNFKVETLKASMTEEEFKSFEPTLENEIAQVPDEMIAIPAKTQRKWFEIYNNEENQWDTQMLTSNWDPSAKWFRPVNYIKI